MEKIKQSEQGFTIVELMVATVVFSVVLLVLTFGVIQMSRIYDKGITETNTQNVARNIMADISQTIEFSGGQVGQTNVTNVGSAGQTFAFCIGDRAYYYQLGYELEDNPSSSQAYHGLVVVDNDNTCPSHSGGYNLKTSSVVPPDAHCPNSPPAGVTCGKEFLLPSMRLTTLKVTAVPNTTNLYSVSVQVTYGDDDLLNNPNNINGLSGNLTNCKGGAGQQFCATSDLQTVVEKRVN